MKRNWWKYVGLALVSYSLVAGLLIKVPDLPVVRESIRNLFFHVPMWFAMMAMFFVSVVNSIRFLSGFNSRFDDIAHQSVNVALLFGLMGILTGMEWATFTWGTPWTNDPQLNGSAVSLLAYLSYLALRRSIDQDSKRARVAAVYNIFAFVMLLVFIGILPRIAEHSIHPATGGKTSTIGGLDTTMRYVFYPAIIGWILISAWLLQQRMYLQKIKNHLQ